MNIDLNNKVALVTGGASGIGNAVARELSRHGAKVIVADRSIKVAEELAEQIGGKAFQADVGNSDEVNRMIQFALESFGALHFAVNNAGISGPALPTADYPIEEWNRVLNINLNGVFHSMKYEIPAMLASGGGSIVNVSSILGTNGWKNSPAYVASKHAVVGLTKAAALEYSAKGIRINAVGPAFIETPMIEESLKAGREKLVALHPIGRLGQPEEVSNLICFLLSENASFITGSYHLVDGGFSAR